MFRLILGFAELETARHGTETDRLIKFRDGDLRGSETGIEMRGENGAHDEYRVIVGSHVDQ